MGRTDPLFAAMKIVCPQCDSWYEVTAASLGRGRTVRCANCKTVWTATPESAVTADASAPAAAMAAAAPGEARAEAAPRPVPAAAASRLVEDDDVPSWDEALAASPASSPGKAATDVADAPSTVPAAGSGGSRESDPDDDEDADESEKDDGETETADNGDDAPPDWEAAFEAAEARRLARQKAVARPPRKRGFRPGWGTAALALSVVVAAILAFRVELVRAMPQTASLFATLGMPVNLRGIAFEDVKVQKDLTEGVPVLIVSGTIVNTSKVRIEIPRLRFAFRNAAGAEVYDWTALPQKSWLVPGEAQRFVSRLASPPVGGHDITVRFFTRQDR